MKDFTLKCYRQYLIAIKSSYSHILRFDDFFSMTTPPNSFVLIRHDVDRNPEKALRMAKLENEMGIHSSYYFRSKSHTFRPEIIKEISEMGHEIGYHYESLSDTNGDMKLALSNFEKNLKRFKNIVPIKTISMHGRPFSPYDSREMWRDPAQHEILANFFCILGELYLDINYKDIAYINDTGRNWKSLKSNKRDKVDSKVFTNFEGRNDLINFFKECKCEKIVFQVHPERWSQTDSEYFFQYIKDYTVNLLKLIIP